MNVLFDSSVLVAALWKWHADHERCSGWLRAAAEKRIQLFVASHSLAETFSVSTRLPTKQRVSPQDAWRVIEADVLPFASLIDVPASKYCSVLAELAKRKIGGGIIYDALIAAAAEISKADRLLTMNTAHYEAVWPDGLDRITNPRYEPAP